MNEGSGQAVEVMRDEHHEATLVCPQQLRLNEEDGPGVEVMRNEQDWDTGNPERISMNESDDERVDAMRDEDDNMSMNSRNQTLDTWYTYNGTLFVGSWTENKSFYVIAKVFVCMII